MQRLIVLPLLLTVIGCVGPADRLVDEVSLTVPASGAELARFATGIGDAEIVGVEGATEVVLIATVRGPNASEAGDDAVMDDLVLELDACGERICARSDLLGSHLRYSLDTELRVPAALRLDVEDGLGDLRIAGVGALQVRDGSGDLDILGVAGPLEVDDDLGDLSLSGVRGPVEVVDGSGDLDIDDVVGTVDVHDDLGDLTVTRIDGDVFIDDGSGDIRVREVTGDVEISDDLGDIDVRDIGGRLTILSDTTGDVRTDGVQGGEHRGE